MDQSLQTPINLTALTLPKMNHLVGLWGWPRFRAQQILRWVFQHRLHSIQDMTNLSKSDRSLLQSSAVITRLPKPQSLMADDGTQKFLFRIEGGGTIESVLIPDGKRLTLCVSTQVGCTLDCVFCLTGQMGLKRNLQVHEIVDQVLTVQDSLPNDRPLTSLVFMGMGEPLANLEAVTEAVAILTNPQWGVGISPRRITISTAGLASRLKDLAPLNVNVAISLNASTNEQRHRLMPTVNQLHPLPELMGACRHYPLRPGRRLTFEYVLLGDINDSEADAKRLTKLLHGIRCKVNLIPFNEFAGSPYRRPSEHTVTRFQHILRQNRVDVFVRKSRGRDILGACGQLGTPPGGLIHPHSLSQ